MPRIPYQQHLAQKAALKAGFGSRRASVVESETDAESLFSSTTFQSNSNSSSSFLHPSSSTRYAHRHHHQYPYSYNGSRTISSTSYDSSSYSRAAASGAAEAGAGAGAAGDQTSSPSSPSFDASRNPNSEPESKQVHRITSNITVKESVKDFGIPLNSAVGSGSRSRSLSPSYLLTVPRKHSLTSISGGPGGKSDRREKRRKEKELKSTLLSGKYDSPLRRWIRYMNKSGFSHYTLPTAILGYIIIKYIIRISAQQEEQDGLKSGWKRSVIEEVVWLLTVHQYVMKQIKSTGRSSRSKITAILTILLSPLSLFSKNRILSMGTILGPITLLSSARDLVSILCLALGLAVKSDGWIWAFGVAVYTIGRGIWMNGIEGITHITLSVTVATLGIASRAITACPTELLRIHSMQSLIRYIHSPWSDKLERVLTTDSGRVDEYCKSIVPFPSISLLIDQMKNHKLQLSLTILSMIPPVSILLYSSLSLRPGNKTRPSPTIHFLPLFLFLISIPIYLFSTDREDIVLPLMPFTLLMGLRGGAAKGSEGNGTEDEIWRIGIGLNFISLINLMPLYSSFTEMAISTGMTILWNTLIGGSPLMSLLIAVRQSFSIIIPSSILLKYILPMEIALCKGVYVIAWFWAMKKLIENAWAIGGLSGNGNKRIKLNLKEKLS
ncbi:uncharacterized protein IL334_001084 [Kwoniella shivajii]|uniref:Oligosaccharide translocation protein RFT1 n=1 Tax=Kwoniella shivajii TaxID=564305 RepID=A0ABZ1CRA8_9TREE|nr:hypothetical protein IL334_001084 [Kwoniella shivajii]